MSITFPYQRSLPTPSRAFDYENEAQFRAMLRGQLTETQAALNALNPVAPARLMLDVVNKTGSNIAVDKLVAVSGLDATTKLPKIVLADADVAAHEDVWVTTAAIANNATGTVYKSALSGANLDTSASGAVGDAAYLSTTAGGFTFTAPSNPNSRVHPVGMVVVDDASVGQILWLIGPVRKIGRNEIQGEALDAGTYTPTLTNVANLDGSTAFVCQWCRIGPHVIVSGKVDVDPTAPATTTQLGISLPIASNFTANQQASGTAAAYAIAGQSAAIIADAANDRAEMQWVAGDITNQAMHFIFSYQIL